MNRLHIMPLMAPSAIAAVPIYMSLIDGTLVNITNFAAGTPQGTNFNP